MTYNCIGCAYKCFGVTYNCIGCAYQCFFVTYHCIRCAYQCFGVTHRCIRCAYQCCDVTYDCTILIDFPEKQAQADEALSRDYRVSSNFRNQAFRSPEEWMSLEFNPLNSAMIRSTTRSTFNLPALSAMTILL